jgi:2-dehydro-3-deoxy-D-arabinonate dehydratase
VDEIRSVTEQALTADAVEGATRLLPPVDGRTEVWASGVTYERSRDARVEESSEKTVYERVYEADRPELFFKSVAWRVVTDGEPIAVRPDCAVTVPEAELAVVVTADGDVFGYTVCDDVSSRDIEGENPLYLPQAKVYAGACALGPAVLSPLGAAPLAIRMRILSETGQEVFAGETSTARMKRTFADLVTFLLRENPVPPGSVLLTGTGLVPPDEFTLEPGHLVEIEVPGIGILANPVVSAASIVERSLAHV